jgi:hypothetical protein
VYAFVVGFNEWVLKGWGCWPGLKAQQEQRCQRLGT